MVGVPDLKPLWATMDRMVKAFERLAKAIEEQNALTKQQMGLQNEHA